MDVAGTDLYFLPLTGSPAAATHVDCDVSNVTFNADTVDTKEGQCISVVGAQDADPSTRHPGTVDVTLSFESANAGHQAIEALATASPPPTVYWAVGESEAPGTAPTVADGALAADVDNKRSWRIFKGWISSWQVTYAFGDQVAVSMTIQRRGDSVRTYAAATP